jgi:predicted N-acetyltransferase YhbS
MAAGVSVRPMQQNDLAEADRVFRLAFGTRLRLPDPMRFRGDSRLLQPRFATDPATAFVALAEGRLVGSIIGMDWGRVFILGPLSVDPAYAGRGIARMLMRELMARVDARGFDLVALFTVPDSPTHIRLYESFGFVLQMLTPVMAKPIAPGGPGAEPLALYSGLNSAGQAEALAGCHAVAAAVFPGLDLSREIRAIAEQRLGEVALLRAGGAVAGFALCHAGAGSEAGSGSLFIKFAAVRPGDGAGFARLLDGCGELGRAVGAQRLIAGCNTGRKPAYALMLSQGFRVEMVGVAMHRPDQPGYNRRDIFVIDDWR